MKHLLIIWRYSVRKKPCRENILNIFVENTKEYQAQKDATTMKWIKDGNIEAFVPIIFLQGSDQVRYSGMAETYRMECFKQSQSISGESI